MKNFRKIILLLLAISLVFALASCGGGGDKNEPCETCVDADGNGKCDKCKNDMPKDTAEDVLLFDEDGQPLFQIVISDELPSSIRQAVNTNIKTYLSREFDVDIDVIVEGASNDEEMETEILVGRVKNRGEKYRFDGHSLGLEGYTVRPVGTKLIIGGGSNEMINEAISLFTDEFLYAVGDVCDLTFTASDIIEYIPDDYDITAIKVNGNDMRDYTLAVDLTRDYYRESAMSMRDQVYERTGYWFEIVDIEDATDKSILMRHNKSLPDSESFKAHAVGTQLLLECAFDNKLFESVTEFSAVSIFEKEGDVDLTGTLYTKDVSVVYYEDFEAVGDGRTDDFEAMYKTHVFANECGQTVKADPDAVYYICNTRLVVDGKERVVNIPVKTNVDWCGAKIIIDDTNIPTVPTHPNYNMATGNIFHVQPNNEHTKIKFTESATLARLVEEGIHPGQTKINFNIQGWDGDLMIVVYNNGHKVFRRKGYAQHSGEPMHELIVIDNEGNVSEETNIMFQYTNLDYIDVYKLDPSSAITIKNATIETKESRVDQLIDDENGVETFHKGYKARGIRVDRSYTTVENIKHVVTGGFNLKERSNGLEGAPSAGMFTANNANHVTFKNCIIPGRQSYNRNSSYNFKANCVNKIVLDHCIQSNFWVEVDFDTGEMKGHTDYADGLYTSMSSVTLYSDGGEAKTHMMHWGIGGTNYCKNMEYIDSKISRFDAHAGLLDGKIIRTEINGMELTGVGTLLMDEITWYPYAATTPFLYLRADYGYHWDGDIIINNADAYMFDVTSNAAKFTLTHYNYSNWYYGYTCAFPNITLDNLEIFSLKTQAPMPAGYEITLASNITPFTGKTHIPGDVGIKITLDYKDDDNDGFIDEPLIDYNLDGFINDLDKVDLDGNGVIGNSVLPYDDPAYEDLTEREIWGGFKHPTCSFNTNIIKPPAYLKIINNNGGYVLNIPRTDNLGVSDGGWNRDADAADSYGGFFGNTKFIFGEGENDYLVGTNDPRKNETTTFKFY